MIDISSFDLQQHKLDDSQLSLPLFYIFGASVFFFFFPNNKEKIISWYLLFWAQMIDSSARVFFIFGKKMAITKINLSIAVMNATKGHQKNLLNK